MGGDVILVGSVLSDEVHEGQGVVGIADGQFVTAEREPGHPTVVELDELPVGFNAMVLRHHPIRALAVASSSAGGLVTEVITIGRRPMRPGAVGTTGDLQLKHAQLNPDLQDVATVPGADLASQHLSRLGIVGPSLDDVVQVLPHPPAPRSRPLPPYIPPPLVGL